MRLLILMPHPCLILFESLGEGLEAELSSFGAHPKTAVPAARVAPCINFRRFNMVCDYVNAQYSNILPDVHFRFSW